MLNQTNISISKNSPTLRFNGYTDAWKKEKLGTLLRIERGGSPRPIESFITTGENGIPWIKIGDLKLGARFVTKTAEKIKPEGVNKSREVYPGDFILSNSMSFGRPYIVKIHGCIHDGWLVLRNESKKEIDDNFLYVLLQTDLVREKFLSLAAGSAVKNLKSETVKGTEVEIPNLAEQVKIANFISSVDSWLDNLHSQKELLKSYKKSTMQKIFSQEIRFKHEDGSDYPEWEEKRLREILKIGSGKDYKHLGIGDVPVFGTGGYMLSVNKVLGSGETVFIGRKGTINKPFYHEGDFWTVDTLFYTYHYMGVSAKFVNILFQRINWLKYNEASGVPSLSKTTIETIKVPLPHLDEQEKITEFFVSIDKAINAKQRQITQAELWKKSLMQRMFV